MILTKTTAAGGLTLLLITVASGSWRAGSSRNEPADRPPAPPIIKALDVDADGIISADELANAVDALASLDSDGDGKLVGSEIHPPHPPHHPHHVGRHRDGHPHHPPGHQVRLGEKDHSDGPDHAERFMARHDFDHDGSVTLEEFTAPARAHYLRHDNDGDGIVTLAEFTSPLQRNFDESDIDGDGNIDLEEAGSFVARHRPPHGDHPHGDHPRDVGHRDCVGND